MSRDQLEREALFAALRERLTPIDAPEQLVMVSMPTRRGGHVAYMTTRDAVSPIVIVDGEPLVSPETVVVRKASACGKTEMFPAELLDAAVRPFSYAAARVDFNACTSTTTEPPPAPAPKPSRQVQRAAEREMAHAARAKLNATRRARRRGRLS